MVSQPSLLKDPDDMKKELNPGKELNTKSFADHTNKPVIVTYFQRDLDTVHSYM